jgi:AcrR family transcriptional regulator
MAVAAQTGASGKRRLIEAALRLSARKRSFSSLGLRELAREAGLNPNTFYRHFRDLDDLGLAIIAEITGDLGKALREIRRSGADTAEVARRTVEYFFDFVRRNPVAFIIGGRELHGASPAMRRALRQVIADMGADMAQDIRAGGLVPDLDDATVAEVTTMIVQQMSYLSLEYLEHPRQRRAIVEQAVKFILMLTAGALALRGMNAGGGNTP